MISIKYFLNRLQDVKPRDYAAFFPMIVALALRPSYKKKYQHSWLICEEPAEARDNGYHFYKYMCEKRPQQKCFYAIKKDSVDYSKVRDLAGDDHIIEYGSVQHWLAYFLCDYNISSQKGGKPDAAVCAFFELNGKFRPHNIFLQHGVIINDVKWLYSDKSKFDLFVTSVRPEQKFIQENFGYKKGVVHLTGLSRFDNLHQNRTVKNRIVIMPTWRYWFNLKSKQMDGLDTDFKSSEYLRKWKELLESQKLNKMIDQYSLEVIFYPHRNIQNHLEEFKQLIHTKATIASWRDYDIQELLITSSMMITDYSSVFFDMIYQKKPVIFYQFDLEKFRNGQYPEGYFHYDDNPFAKSFKGSDDVLIETENIIKNEYQVDEKYMKGHEEYFQYYDSNNSERIYNLLKYKNIK